MKREEIKRNRIDYKTKETIEETIIKITPENGKCFQNKKTGHKFIHTNGKQGLPLYVRDEEGINLYDEVNI